MPALVVVALNLLSVIKRHESSWRRVNVALSEWIHVKQAMPKKVRSKSTEISSSRSEPLQRFVDMVSRHDGIPGRLTELQAEVICDSPLWKAWLDADCEDVSCLAGELVRGREELEREFDAELKPLLAGRKDGDALCLLRRLKQRELLRCALRQMGDASREEVCRQRSDLADVCVRMVLQICFEKLRRLVGRPYHQDANGSWVSTGYSVMAVDQLGARELDFCSPLKLLFVYDGEGHVFERKPGKSTVPMGKSMTNHRFFTRVAEAMVASLSNRTSDGCLYPLALDVRPEGARGPLVRSMESYETYYSEWGEGWERMMLLKLRTVAGDEEVGDDFIGTMQPFRYPRCQREKVRRQLGGVRSRLDDAGSLVGEIGLLELVLQSLGVLHGGYDTTLQVPKTVELLERLAGSGRMSAMEAQQMRDAHRFLSVVSDYLQLQTGKEDGTGCDGTGVGEQISELAGFEGIESFERTRRHHAENVRHGCLKMLAGEGLGPEVMVPKAMADMEDQWKRLLGDYSFIDVDRSFDLLHEFAYGPSDAHVMAGTTDLAWRLFPKFFSLCQKKDSIPGRSMGEDTIILHKAVEGEAQDELQSPLSSSRQPVLSDPDQVLVRLDEFVSVYGSRAVLYQTWEDNPHLFEWMLLLFDRSEFLSEIAIRTPEAIDDLVMSGRLAFGKSREEMLEELESCEDRDEDGRWLRSYCHGEFLRVGLRDILGIADLDQTTSELSMLAEACMDSALVTVLNRHRLDPSSIAIIGLGKLGGMELTYGSDLDVVFVVRSDVGERSRFHGVVAEVMELLSGQTHGGRVYATDARLRPHGDKGLLVNTIEAHEEYYQGRAQLWELQALTRARFVAGNPELGRTFERLSQRVTDFAGLDSKEAPAAYTLEWKREVDVMRKRIEKERSASDRGEISLKTGSGGLIDVEFVAQMICLARGWHEPNTSRVLHRARVERVFDGTGLLRNYRTLRKVEGALRRWSFRGESRLPSDSLLLDQLAVRCGWESGGDMMRVVDRCRRAIRRVYDDAVSTLG